MNIQINKVPYEEDKTDSVMNLGNKHNEFKLQSEAFLDNLMKYHDIWPCPEYNSKTVYKIVFGKQLTCVTYSYRNWIWTFSDENNEACLNVLCSERGRSFEYRKGSDFKKLKEIIGWVESMLLDSRVKKEKVK
jgi:hypothetical protein